MDPIHQPILLVPQYRKYVWGGNRLKPGESPVAEAWVVYEKDEVANGPLAGRTLADLVAHYGASLLGQHAIETSGLRFPLLIKLLDCAQWLSLQVHPNDEQAKKLEGPNFIGKTEAWHFLETETGAEILCGLRPGTSEEDLEKAIRSGTVVEIMQRLQVHAGESIFIPAGTIHALGPGLLLYEIQQSSDTTYRVFDWNRPNTKERPLHIEKSLAVVDPKATSQLLPLPELPDGSLYNIISCPYFKLETLAAQLNKIVLDRHGESFDTLTVVHGSIHIEGDGWKIPLNRLETTLVPAGCGPYQIIPNGSYRILRATVG
ncbi:MAG TPA: type I phosphomannose isomerase catalytic subunit [Anaerolineaceae bacterium]|nr:type I phosphomannose isomerase catalytic subunit [Anaerolineaceae bacterium]